MNKTDVPTRATPLELTVFYGISSPWAYFGAPRLAEIARRTGARITLRTMRVIEANGGIPLRTRPQPRQNYHEIELTRWRKKLDMPLNERPRFYPCSSIEPAAQSVLAVQGAGLDAMAYSFAVQRALWAEERDIADIATLQDIARATVGEKGVSVISDPQSPAIVQAWKDNLAEAQRLQIFGSPTYVVGTELFWGQDRLEFVEDALRRLAPEAA